MGTTEETLLSTLHSSIAKNFYAINNHSRFFSDPSFLPLLFNNIEEKFSFFLMTSQKSKIFWENRIMEDE